MGGISSSVMKTPKIGISFPSQRNAGILLHSLDVQDLFPHRLLQPAAPFTVYPQISAPMKTP